MIDVGCGVRRSGPSLGQPRHARVIAIEPEPQTSPRRTRSRHRFRIEGLTYVEAGAEALPCSSASVRRRLSLANRFTTCPPDAMEQGHGRGNPRATRDDGFLYVLEPEAEGPYSDFDASLP